jgi:hypothetical protein
VKDYSTRKIVMETNLGDSEKTEKREREKHNNGSNG